MDIYGIFAKLLFGIVFGAAMGAVYYLCVYAVEWLKIKNDARSLRK